MKYLLLTKLDFVAALTTFAAKDVRQVSAGAVLHQPLHAVAQVLGSARLATMNLGRPLVLVRVLVSPFAMRKSLD